MLYDPNFNDIFILEHLLYADTSWALCPLSIQQTQTEGSPGSVIVLGLGQTRETGHLSSQSLHSDEELSPFYR